ncbi:MAG TPA: ABC transporter permease [Nocardioidaceae bacterium]|jgi:osmoprotectant transport system permease protein|nr:ABC transporter permease [Nocardioidaceae bacterium]
MIAYIQGNQARILSDLGQHVWLSLLPVLVGVVLALPAGYLTVRYRWLYQPVVNLGGILYSVPSLALFVVIPAIIPVGTLSPLNIVVALSVYSFALLARTVADALISVQGETTWAAAAMGFRPLRQLFGVELPMALPVMMAGLRVATVSNISLVSVGAIIGVGGLGDLFTRGLQLSYLAPIIVGIVLSVLLAAVCDSGIVLVQRWLTPWTRAGAR